MRGAVFLVVVFLDFGFMKAPSSNRTPKDSSSSLEYYTNPNQATIPIMVHIDHILTKQLSKQYGPKTRQKLKITSQNIVKEVDNFFKHPTLNQTINFVLLDTKFLKNNSNVVAMSEDGSKYLKSYCEWQGMKKRNKRYYSVLLTGLDIYVNNKNAGRSSTGRGYMGGICSVKKSCALLEWHPTNIGYLMAHEIAHSVGVAHDGRPFNQCKSQGHMMAAKYNPKFHPRSWSPCSRRSMKWYLRSRRTRCLRPEYEISSGD